MIIFTSHHWTGCDYGHYCLLVRKLGQGLYNRGNILLICIYGISFAGRICLDLFDRLIELKAARRGRLG